MLSLKSQVSNLGSRVFDPPVRGKSLTCRSCAKISSGYLTHDWAGRRPEYLRRNRDGKSETCGAPGVKDPSLETRDSRLETEASLRICIGRRTNGAWPGGFCRFALCEARSNLVDSVLGSGGDAWEKGIAERRNKRKTLLIANHRQRFY